MCFPFPNGREIFGEFYLVKSSTSQEGKEEEEMVLFLAFGMMTSGIAIYIFFGSRLLLLLINDSLKMSKFFFTV